MDQSRLTVNQRVRTSELFPRIRDAENEIKQSENEFFIQREEKIRKKERREKYKKLKKKGLIVIPASDERKPPKQIPKEEYFSEIVLNKDKTVSKYIQFDSVYFPRLFEKASKNNHQGSGIVKSVPESIESVWMLGFEDHRLRTQNNK
eukprot:gene5046-7043_t